MLKCCRQECSVTNVQGQSAALPGTVTQRLLLTQGSDPFPSELHSPPSTPASSAAGTLCWGTGSSLGSPLLWKSNEYNYHNHSKNKEHNSCAILQISLQSQQLCCAQFGFSTSDLFLASILTQSLHLNG